MRALATLALAVVAIASPSPGQMLVPNGPGNGAAVHPPRIMVFSSGGAGTSGTLPGLVFSVAATPDNVAKLVDFGYQVCEAGDVTIATGTPTTGAEHKPVYTTSWTDPNTGITNTVITPKKPYESSGNHAWRHKAAVSALANNYGSGYAPTLPGSAGPAATYSNTTTGSVMVTSWKSKEGGGITLEHQVETEKKAGETEAQQAGRHKKAVNALLDVFPPFVETQTSSLLRRAGGLTQQRFAA